MLHWTKSKITRSGPTVSVVRLQGSIASGGGRFSKNINIQTAADPLERAFKLKPSKAVFVIINSPGGSPVQSSLVAKRIRYLADKYKKPVFAVVEDVAASGGYWIACAADEIHADAASIVGSIGVIRAGFGFDELIARYGIQRRVTTAGENKLKLDPFQPEKESDQVWLKGLFENLHQTFIDHVRARRQGKLQGEDASLMNGDVWLGPQALELGLIDGLGDLISVAQDKFGPKVRFQLFEQRRGGVLSMFGARLGLGQPEASWADQAIAAAEERALWARFGL
jgi:signal peptide peptidase SppA